LRSPPAGDSGNLLLQLEGSNDSGLAVRLTVLLDDGIVLQDEPLASGDWSLQATVESAAFASPLVTVRLVLEPDRSAADRPSDEPTARGVWVKTACLSAPGDGT
jgi:hypothetical protein